MKGAIMAAVAVAMLTARGWAEVPKTWPFPPDPTPGGPKAVIVGPEEGDTVEWEAGDLLVLRSTGSKGDAFTWLVFPPKMLARTFLAEGGRTLVFATREKATVYFALIAMGGKELDTAMYTVHNGRPKPDPDPEPEPDPDPTPGKRFALVVTETRDRGPELARLLMRLRVGGDLGDTKLLLIDDDAVNEHGKSVESLKPYLDRIGDTKYPVLFLISSGKTSSRVLYKGTLPSYDETIKLIRRHGG